MGEVIDELVAFDTEDKIDQIESYGENNIARYDDLYTLPMRNTGSIEILSINVALSTSTIVAAAILYISAL